MSLWLKAQRFKLSLDRLEHENKGSDVGVKGLLGNSGAMHRGFSGSWENLRAQMGRFTGLTENSMAYTRGI